jgi:hypothetical protein
MCINLAEVETLVRIQALFEFLLFLHNMTLLGLNEILRDIDSAAYFWKTPTCLWHWRCVRVLVRRRICLVVFQSLHNLTVGSPELARISNTRALLLMMELICNFAHLVNLTFEFAHKSDWQVRHEEQRVNSCPCTFTIKIRWQG